MDPLYERFIVILIAYLFGSMPCGYWYARWSKAKEGVKNFDIRDWGSGNIGFTNVWKVLGKEIAIPVLVFDIAKGLLPSWLCLVLFGPWWSVGVLFAAAIGHYRSIYFFCTEKSFSGGKSVATVFGAMVPLQPCIAGTALVVWAIVLLTTEYMSLASICGAFAAFVASIVFHFCWLHLPVEWVYVFLGVLVLICLTHNRNIAKLLSGLEPKITEDRGAGGLDPKKAIAAFALHPLGFEDILQMSGPLTEFLKKRNPSERDFFRLLRHLPVIEYDFIRKIKTKGGPEVEGGDVEVTDYFLVIPLLPDQIKAVLEEETLTGEKEDSPGEEESSTGKKIRDPFYAKRLEYLLRCAAVIAKRRGAVVLTLGALLSTEGNGGADLQTWCDERGLGLQIDNGAVFTVAATLVAMEREAPKPLEECVMAMIGASGFIGGTTVRIISELKKAKKILAYARHERKMVGLEKTLATLLTSDDLSRLVEADIVVLATSSPEFIITPENCHLLKRGALILDVAVPRDFDPEVLKIRPDLGVVCCGLIDLPGDPTWKIDLHFGSTLDENGKKRNLVPACLAGGTAFAATRRSEYVSTGMMVRREDVEFVAENAERLGYRIVTSDVSEPELFKRVVAS